VRAGTTTLPLEPGFEHVLVVLDGLLVVDDRPVTPGQSAYLGAGRDEVVLRAPTEARVLVLGGTPFDEPLLMWWNFVARTREEIDEARRQWAAQDDRFGRVASPLAAPPRRARALPEAVHPACPQTEHGEQAERRRPDRRPGAQSRGRQRPGGSAPGGRRGGTCGAPGRASRRQG
jgi:hypothetical protein